MIRGRLQTLAQIGGILLTLSGCGGEKMKQTAAPPEAPLGLPDSALRALAEQRVFFAHQSVGANLIQGVEEWMARDPRVRLHIVQSKDPQGIEGPGLIHAFVGENGNPASKLKEFSDILARGMGRAGGIALLKFCYLDFDPSTEADSLFERYRREAAALQSAYPALRLAHVTAPLTVDESFPRLMVKRLVGKPTSRDLNGKRNRYNRLLLAEYGGGGAVFDLAAAESTQPGGGRQFVRVGRDTVFTLAPELTSDGGHLNALGRRLVAARFLAFLAGLSSHGPR